MTSFNEFERLFPDAHIVDLGEIVGDRVICDLCGADWSNREETGGILVQSKAICPDCCDTYEEGLQAHGELELLRARCPYEKSFAQWVREDLR